MGMKMKEKLMALPGQHHLTNYEEVAKSHNWADTEKAFSWSETGLVNMAYEAIDRHTETHRKNKVALYFNDGKRKEAYSFNEMKRLTNKAANVLKPLLICRKVIVYLFLCLVHLSFTFHY